MEECHLVNLQAETCIFIKSNTPPWVFFTIFKLHKWYRIAQRISNAKDNFRAEKRGN